MVNGIQYKQTVTYRQNNSQFSKKEKTASEWNDIWLNKFENVSRIEKLEATRIVQMRQIISGFLSNTPGSPYCIKEENFTGYLKKADHVHLETIRFFYEKVAISVKYEDKVKKYLTELNTCIYEKDHSLVVKLNTCNTLLIDQQSDKDHSPADQAEIDRYGSIKGIQEAAKFSDSRVYTLQRISLRY